MKKHDAVIPVERFAILQWEDEGFPAICSVNQALANYPSKTTFAWHLSIVLELEECTPTGMPTAEEKAVIDGIGKLLDTQIKENGNSLFLARITWRETRQILYRVYDPELANSFLMEWVESDSAVRPLSFTMENDADWTLANWYLQNWES